VKFIHQLHVTNFQDDADHSNNESESESKKQHSRSSCGGIANAEIALSRFLFFFFFFFTIHRSAAGTHLSMHGNHHGNLLYEYPVCLVPQQQHGNESPQPYLEWA
jgi:hypothetical protein